MSTGLTTGTGRTAWTTLALPRSNQSFVKVSDESLASRDPATGELVATVGVSTAEDVAAAVDQARAA